MKNGWIDYAMEELKFVRSFSDFLNLCDKFWFASPVIVKLACRLRKAPLCLQIEVTNKCNINCICCSRDVMKRETGYMDYDLFRKIIDDAADCGVKRVHLYLHGEPFLHPRIAEMIRYTKRQGLGITLATNGTLLDKSRIAEILQAEVNNADHLMFSVLGYSKAVHERVMRGVKHENVLENIHDFVEMRKERRINGPVLETVMYLMPENREEELSFARYWRNVVDHVRRVGEIKQQFSQYGNSEVLPQRKVSCKNVWERMTIFWNGDVTLCIADLDGECNFGNLRDSGIREIWNSPAMLDIREKHEAKQFESLALCSNCDW